MKRKSEKKAAEEAEWGPIRAEYVRAHPICPVTGTRTSECHEILAGSYRHKSYKEPCCWLALSREGHEYMQGQPFDFQLAFKLKQSPDTLDLNRFNEIYRPNASEPAVTMRDIVRHLEVTMF